MRSTKNKHDKKKRGFLPNSIGLSILMLLCIISFMVFMGLLTLVNALPVMYVLILFGVLVVLLIVAILLMNSRKPRTKKRIIGAILAVLLIVGMGFGSYYLYHTYDTLNKISTEGTQTEDFHVVVLAEGSYAALNDINDQTVFVTANESDNYKEAKGKLMSEVTISYEEAETYLAAGNKLVDAEGGTHDQIIFVSNTNYEMACEEIAEFETNTKIIHTISIEMESNDIAKRVDVTEDSFNVYITGIDTYGNISSVARSDVNMIMTVNPRTRQILLTSIPRDMYVPLHSYGQLDKLTHSGIYGVEETIATVEDWLDIEINYYIRVNFTTVVDIIDVLGGVDVESAHTFSAGGYSFVEGTNHLSGEEALAFARERYSFSGGDRERVKNQQRVLTGIIQKITGSTAILTNYTDLLNAMENKMQTNMSNQDISALVKMQLEDLGGWTITSISIDGTGAYNSTYSMGSQQLYVMIPDEETVTNAQQQINQVMYAEP